MFNVTKPDGAKFNGNGSSDPGAGRREEGSSMEDQLDNAIEVLVLHGEALHEKALHEEASHQEFPSPETMEPGAQPAPMDFEMRELLGIAADLRGLPRPDFKASLLASLLAQAVLGFAPSPHTNAPVQDELPTSEFSPAKKSAIRGPKAVLTRSPDWNYLTTPSIAAPTFGSVGNGGAPLGRRGTFLASVAMHAAAMLFLASATLWMAKHSPAVKQDVVAILISPGSNVLPPADIRGGGGGGGGERDRVQANRGNPPDFSMDPMRTPPTAIIRNQHPMVAVEQSVMVPPQLQLSQGGQVGDPLSNLPTLSNGVGYGGGMGSGGDGGIGSGDHRGLGPGTGGFTGGGYPRVGGGVSAPSLLYSPDPQYSEEALRVKYEGTVVLWAVVDASGHPVNMRVARALGMGLDQKAMEAVKKWRFQPAMKDGKPVAVEVNIEVSFHLY